MGKHRKRLNRQVIMAAVALCAAFSLAYAAVGVYAAPAAVAPQPTVNPTVAALMELDRTVKATQTAQAAAAVPAVTPMAPNTPADVVTSAPTSTPVHAAPTVAAAATHRAQPPLAEVLVDGLNIRSGAGSSFESIGKASAGMLLPITGQSGSCTWLQVVLEDGGTGWISGNAAYSTINVECAVIPAAASAAPASAQALPTPTQAVAKMPSATSTPRAALKATPKAIPTAEAQPPAVVVTAQTAASPGQITSFEPLGDWRRGDEPNGTLQQSAVEVSDGAMAARIDYNFPAEAGSKNYVVFLAQAPLRIPDDATGLQMQVFGDGSGHFLNAWVVDAGGQTWQYTFGRVEHTGWAPMTASLAPSREWPNGPVGDAADDGLKPPLRLKALVLDGVPDGTASSGTIYLDDLVAVTGATLPASNKAATGKIAAGTEPANAGVAQAPAAAPADVPASAPASAPSGKIAFTRFNGQKMNTLVYDLAAGKIVAELPNTRHPDLAGGLMLVNGDGGGQETILRMTDTGGNPRPITTHPEDTYPQWSPSMASLAYASTSYGDRRSRLFYQEDAGAQFEVGPMMYAKRELFGDNPVYLDNWRIAFQGCNTWAGGSKCGIYSVDSRGNEPVQATSLTADIPTGNLQSQILFTSNRSGNYDVWAVNWDGSNLRQLTDNPAVDGLATASPDYQHIAFVSNRDGVWSVYVMNVDGSNQRKLFDIGGGYGSGDYEWYRERISWGP